MLYIPPHFRDEDPEALAGFMAARGFATLVTLGRAADAAPELDLTLLPLLYQPGGGPRGRLVGHVARANRQWQRLDGGVAAMALFQGGDYYVTPSWYPGKAEHGRVVPTWNYEAVVAWGRLTVLEAPEQILPIVTALTERHEGRRAAPWSVEDAPPEFIRAQLRGIVGLELAVERLEGKRKLSQNRNEADRAGVFAGLARERT